MTDKFIESLQERYLSDLEDIITCEDETSGRSGRVVMLSGGIDSLLLVVAIRHLFPGEPLRTIHIQGYESEDSRGAEAVAREFNTEHQVFEVTLDDVLSNLARIKGTGYSGISRIISHICYELCFERMGVSDHAVYSGNGADVIYGNFPHIAETADHLLNTGKYENIDAARMAAKTSCYADRIADKQYFSQITKRFNATAVLPYTSPKLRYLITIPQLVSTLWDKSFVKDAMRRRYGLGEIVERQRMSMQSGLGLRDVFKKELRERYAHRSKSTSRIITSLTD